MEIPLTTALLLMIAGLGNCNVTSTTTKPPEKSDFQFSKSQLKQLQEIQKYAIEGGLPQEDVDSMIKYDKSVCYTDACLESTLEIMNATNFTANPCDYHQWKDFACMRRLNRGESQSQLNKLVSDAAVQTSDLLEDTTGKFGKHFLLKEAQTYYQQCINKGSNDKADVKRILEYMAGKYGNWPTISNLEPGDKFDWLKMVADMNSIERDGFTPQLLTVEIESDEEKNNTLYFKLRTVVTPLPEDTMSDYIKLLTRVHKRAGLQKPWRLSQVIKEQKFLKEAKKVLDDSDDFDLKEMTINELQNTTDFYFKENNITLKNINWKKFFSRIAPQLDISDKMTVTLFFKDVMSIMASIDETFKDQGMSPVANSLHSHIVTVLLLETTDLTADLKRYQCTEKSGEIEDLCSERVQTIFSVALGKAYLSEFYSGNLTTAGIQGMMKNMIGAYKAIIWDTDWMSNVTKEFLDNKLNDMVVAYTQPDWINEPGKLEEFYNGLKASADVNSSYPENYVNVERWYTSKLLMSQKRALEGLSRTPVDKKAYFDYIVLSTYTGDVNAFYLTNTNQIFVTGGISHSPLFDVNRPGFMNYGGLGSVLGHEIGHSFDTDGRKYDTNGKEGEHWDQESADRYEKLWVKRIAADYNANLQNFSDIYYEGLTADQTIDEDIADIFGVYVSFESYIDYLTSLKKEGKSELILPGLKKFSPEKLFYMKYANVWCEKNDVQTDYLTTVSDKHSSGNVRATMPLRRSRQFAETFGCATPQQYD